MKAYTIAVFAGASLGYVFVCVVITTINLANWCIHG